MRRLSQYAAGEWGIGGEGEAVGAALRAVAGGGKESGGGREERKGGGRKEGNGAR